MSKNSASIDAAFDNAEKRVKEAIQRGVRKASEFLLEQARRRVPIETGALSRSGHVLTIEDAVSVVGYVIFDTPYATRQHEDPDLKHDPGRTFKYLERPALELRDTLFEIIADEVRKALL